MTYGKASASECVERAKKLLALAASSTHENEAEVAREKARRLLAPFGLTFDDLQTPSYVAATSVKPKPANTKMWGSFAQQSGWKALDPRKHGYKDRKDD